MIAYDGGISFFDDISECNPKQIDQLFTGERQKYLENFPSSQSKLDFTKRTIGSNSSIIILFEQILKDVKTFFCYAGFVMSCEGFSELCGGICK